MMRYRFRLYAVVAMLSASLLSACGAKIDDLEEFVTEVKARPRGKIEALPQYPPYKTYIYNSLAMRAPFDRPAPKEEKRPVNAVISERKPDLERPRFPLEQYTIKQLKMVGVIGDKKNQQALVRVGGQVHRVAIGDYVGKNDGLVTAVDERQFNFVELVLAGVDVWTERPRAIKLSSGGGKK